MQFCKNFSRFINERRSTNEEIERPQCPRTRRRVRIRYDRKRNVGEFTREIYSARNVRPPYIALYYYTSAAYYMNFLIAVVRSLRSAKTVQLFFGYCSFGETLSLRPIFVVVVIVAVFMIVYITRIAHSSTHNSVRRFQHEYPSENALILLSFRFTLTFRKSLGLMVNMGEN